MRIMRTHMLVSSSLLPSKLRGYMAAVALLSLFFALPAFAQIAGQLQGRIVDPSGAVVAGARVTLTNLATNAGISTSTTGSGDYIFVNVLPGTYRVDVSAKGFSSLARSGITVVTGKSVTADLRMMVGQ